MRKIWLLTVILLAFLLPSCESFEMKSEFVKQTTWEVTFDIQTTESSADEEKICEYILNTNTMKFHDPNCYTAEWIKDTNRQEHHGTKGELISRGYSACRICNP